MVNTGIKGEFWIEDIKVKDINMQKVFKARGLKEVTKEKRGDPRTKHGCFEIRNIKKNLQRTLRRCRQQELLPWKTCEEKVFLGGKVNKMLIFPCRLRKWKTSMLPLDLSIWK